MDSKQLSKKENLFTKMNHSNQCMKSIIYHFYIYELNLLFTAVCKNKKIMYRKEIILQTNILAIIQTFENVKVLETR